MSADTYRNGTIDTAATDPKSTVHDIKVGIERTQADLADTLDALHRQLQPRRMVNRARAAAREYASTRARSAADTGLYYAALGATHAERAAIQLRDAATTRPVPLVLIGTGLVSLFWLWRNRRRTPDRDWDHHLGKLRQ